MTASVTRISPDTTYSAQTTDFAGSNGTGSVRATALKSAGSLGQPDEVKLSPDAEAKLLRGQGETITEIAQHLECTAKEVEAYLGTTDTTAGSSGATDSET